MIAILSDTYGNMLESGTFSYKCKQYIYCERYMIAFTEKQYGEMIIHASPINFLCLLMLPFSLLGEKVRLVVTKLFALSVYWGENLIGMCFFVSFEALLLPILYVQITFNIGYSTRGMFTTVFNVFVWLWVGLVYLPFLLLLDAFTLLKILALHQGCIEYKAIKENDKEKQTPTEEEIEAGKQEVITRMNEIREVILKQYEELANKKKDINVDDNYKPPIYDTVNAIQTIEDDEKLGYEFIHDELFTIKMVALHDKWKQSKVTQDDNTD